MTRRQIAGSEVEREEKIPAGGWKEIGRRAAVFHWLEEDGDPDDPWGVIESGDGAFFAADEVMGRWDPE